MLFRASEPTFFRDTLRRGYLPRSELRPAAFIVSWLELIWLTSPHRDAGLPD